MPLFTRPAWLNRNVGLVLIQSAIGGFGYGFAWNVPAVIYVYQITNHSSAMVGYIEGIQGIFQAAAAFPAGWAADKFRRDHVLKVCALLTVVGVVFTAVGVLSDDLLPPDSFLAQHRYAVLCIGYSVMGVTWGAASPASDAIFADSVQTGARSKIYTILGSISFFANGLGQAVTMLLFYLLGNKWVDDDGKLTNLTIIMVAGLALQIPSAVAQMFFDDTRALGATSDSVQDQLAEDEDGEGTGLRSSAARMGDEEGGAKEKEVGKKEEEEEEVDEAEAKIKRLDKLQVCGCVTVDWIPAIQFASDLLICLASGMTIKFFPIFFQQECGLSPVGVNAIFVVAPILMSLASPLAQKISSCGVGRMQTSLLFQWIGISMLALMSARHFGGYDTWTRKVAGVRSGIVVVMYITRTVLMNSIWPLEKSLMMDYVTKKARAKWSSLDAISSFGWSGSAVVGGLIVEHFKVACDGGGSGSSSAASDVGSDWCHGGYDDSRGFEVLFCITASMQMLSTLPKILICLLVPRNEAVPEAKRAQSEASPFGADDDETEPLLGSRGSVQAKE